MDIKVIIRKPKNKKDLDTCQNEAKTFGKITPKNIQ